MPEEGVQHVERSLILQEEEILRICRVMAELGIRKIDLPDTQLCHHPADPQNFLFLQNEGALHMLHSLLRHTINTPEITTVCHGNPEIIYISPTTVNHCSSSKRKSPLFPPVFSIR
jgi:hypothetical protein